MLDFGVVQCLNKRGQPFKELWQWDKDITIVLKGMATLSPLLFVFRNKLTEYGISVESTIQGEDLLFRLPNILLEEAKTISGDIYNGEANKSNLIGSIYIPVQGRPKPSDNVYTE